VITESDVDRDGELSKPESDPTPSSERYYPTLNGHKETDLEASRHLQAPDPTTQPPRNIHGWKGVLVVISILSSVLLFALDNSIVADIQPRIVEQFNSVDKLPWLSVAFSVGATAMSLTWYAFLSWCSCGS
jgi:hypothetical protein